MKMAQIQIPILKCKRCGYKWIPRKMDVRICPHCKSAWWDESKNIKNKEGL